jgi:hypothetical protein
VETQAPVRSVEVPRDRQHRLLKTRDPAEAESCRLSPMAYVYITASLRSFDALKAIFLLALILMVSPVAGLRPIRAARLRTWRMPRPGMRMREPFFRCLIIDKQRIAAVRKLEAMGYTFHEHDWTGPAIPATFEADAMHALLVLRADAIEGCTGGSEEEREFAMIAEAVEAYEAIRWPDGKVQGGKG